MMLITLGCVGDPPNTIDRDTTPLQTEHTYAEGQSTLNTNPQMSEIDAANEENSRVTWQKPNEVLRRLGGDLGAKTIADIGAGPNGYFTFKFVNVAKKVIAIDIDKDAIDFMESGKVKLPEVIQKKMETRLVPYDDPMLKKDEADIVFISNTFPYIENQISYLEKVKDGMPVGGRICIVDFKMRKIPAVFPPVDGRLPLYKVEEELEAAGFQHLISYDDVLEYQYIVIAEKVK